MTDETNQQAVVGPKHLHDGWCYISYKDEGSIQSGKRGKA